MPKCLNVNMTKGFTLMEAIVAIFLLTVGIIGVSILITNTISSTRISTDKLIASYLAQEGIEIVRNIRDTNWLEPSHSPPAPHPWDEGLTTCGGACDATTGNGCIADYISSADSHPNLTTYTGQVLNIDTANGFYSYSALTPTKFKRKIVIMPAGDILNVCILIEWQAKGKTYQIEAQENLYNWKL